MVCSVTANRDAELPSARPLHESMVEVSNTPEIFDPSYGSAFRWDVARPRLVTHPAPFDDRLPDAMWAEAGSNCDGAFGAFHSTARLNFTVCGAIRFGTFLA